MSAPRSEAITAALADRYTVEREIGRGGMATVHLALDRKHGRRVALKILREELASAVGSSRFLREISIAARLQHPNILTLIDSGELRLDGGETALFYVMPFVEGETLRQRLAREGAIAAPVALRWLREVVDALSSAHAQGVVHRDIKPENVMLSGGHALVVDFGIAKAMQDSSTGDTLTGTGISLGTPAYMAPEQVVADPSIDHRADIYAVGVLAYEMLTGAPPFGGSPQAVLSAHVTAAPPPLSGTRGDVPRELASIITRCLEKDPARRWRSASELLTALDAVSEPSGTAPRTGSRTRVAVGAGVVLLLAALGWWMIGERRTRWVHTEAIPAIRALADEGDFERAFELARRAERIQPDDPVLASLWPLFSYRFVFRTDPSGANVLRASLDDTTTWETIGITPTDSVWVPRTVGYYRFERPGHHPQTLLVGGFLGGPGNRYSPSGAALPVTVPLMPDTLDARMVLVAGGWVTEDREDDSPTMRNFHMGRYEVTNREYKQFVDEGGYLRRELWTEPFVVDGRTLTWEEGIALFVDRTGRAGPATWEAGAPPEGEEDHPVGGVSWYEAMAYARFRGMALPTLVHWSTAASPQAAAYVLPRARFESTSALPVGTAGSVSPWGLYDVAGNAREWLMNEGRPGTRHIAGGAYSDPPYRFTDQFTRPPIARDPINGIRLASYPEDDPHLRAALAPVSRPTRDYSVEGPVPDEVFHSYRVLYDYDRLPLDVRVETSDSSHADWVRQVVSFTPAQGSERMRAVLFLPKRGTPPYQTVLMFPGSHALFEESSDRIDAERLGFIMRSGRAVLHPIYRLMYERRTGEVVRTDATVAYRDAVIAWGREYRRALDFIEARADLDANRIGFIGMSLGARHGGVLLAIDDRVKAAILTMGGFSHLPSRPEVDPVNFLPRIRMPVLMMNGKYDDVFPVESSQRPFFEAIGTPAGQKRYELFEEAHGVPRAAMIRETLGWYDRYLGVPR